MNDTGPSSHIDKMALDGYQINPKPFSKLAAWSRIMLQLVASQHSLESLENFEQKMMDLGNSLDQLALLHSFILQYGKCFTSVGSGLVKLDAKKVFVGMDQLRATHERIINLRHNTFAHNDVGDLLQSDILVREEDSQIFVKHTFTMAIPRDEFPRWGGLLEHVQQYATDRLNKHLDTLQGELGKPIMLG